MNRLIVVLLCLFVSTAAFAADSADLITVLRNGQIEAGGTFRNSDAGKAGELYVDALAPLAGHLSVGPILRLHYQGREEGYGFGGLVEYAFGKGHFQPYLAGDIVRWAGGYEASVRYQVAASGGFKLGTDKAFLRVGVARTRAYSGSGGGIPDTTSIVAGIGIRL